jgi:hypothetical protein
LNAWGMVINGSTCCVALRTRRDVQRWAGQRYVAADVYDAFKHDPSGLWIQVQRGHPDARLVRVQIMGSRPQRT